MSHRAEGPPTSNVMEVSTYSQVVFNGVPQSYIPNAPIKCSYTMTTAIEPHRRDWVGIFKVGWSTTRDYYTFVWAAPCCDPVGDEAEELHVIFDAYYLPKEDGEFYQFCFVDSCGQVKGASTPFRFESPVESSLDYSMENDLLVISTQEQVEQVERDKKELCTELEKQKEANEILRAELNERLLEIRRFKESNVELCERVSQLEMQQVQSTMETKEESEQWASQPENIDLEELQREGEVLRQNVSSWQDNYQQAMSKMNQMEQEKAELKEQISAQEAEITQLGSSIRKMEQEKQQNLKELQTQHDHIILLQVDLQSSQKETVKLAGEVRSLRAQAMVAEGPRHESQALQRTLSAPDGEDREDLEKQEVNKGLCKEELSSKEVHAQTTKALQELQAEKKKLEKQLKVFQEKAQLSSKLEKQLVDMQRIVDEQVNAAQIMTGEKERLSQDNQELKRTIEKLHEELALLEASSVPSSVSLRHPNPYAPSAGSIDTQTPVGDPVLYHDPFEVPATSRTNELLRVCRYCQEIFPGIKPAELLQHEESHKVCPFCTLICDAMEQQDFEEHVYSHE